MICRIKISGRINWTVKLEVDLIRLTSNDFEADTGET